MHNYVCKPTKTNQPSSVPYFRIQKIDLSGLKCTDQALLPLQLYLK